MLPLAVVAAGDASGDAMPHVCHSLQRGLRAAASERAVEDPRAEGLLTPELKTEAMWLKTCKT